MSRYRATYFSYKGVHFTRCKEGWRQYGSGLRLFLMSKRWSTLADAMKAVDGALKC